MVAILAAGSSLPFSVEATKIDLPELQVCASLLMSLIWGVICVYEYARMQYTRIHAQERTHTHAHTHTHTHTHTDTHKHTYIHTHTYTHTHMRIQILTLMCARQTHAITRLNTHTMHTLTHLHLNIAHVQPIVLCFFLPHVIYVSRVSLRKSARRNAELPPRPSAVQLWSRTPACASMP